MKTKQKVLDILNSDAKIKRIQELETFIDNSPVLKELLERKKEVSKQMVACKHIGLYNAYNEYKKEYDDIDIQIANYPNVEEYMELLDEAYNDYEIIVKYIENKVNDKLN